MAIVFCPNCGAERLSGSRFCGACGADLEALEPVAREPALAATAPPEVPPTQVARAPAPGPASPPPPVPTGPTPAPQTVARWPFLALVALAVVLVVAAAGAYLLLGRTGPSSPPEVSAGPTTQEPNATASVAQQGNRLRIEYQALPAGGKTPTWSDLATIAGIIERRVNATGTVGATVWTHGSDRVFVEVPGATDPNQIRMLVGKTGSLTFVPLPSDVYGTISAAGTKSPPAAGEPIDPTLAPLFGGDQVASADPSYDSRTGERAVAFKLKDDATTKFGAYTQAHVGEYFAIVLDGTVVSAPYIKSAITDGSGQISGSFTAPEMNNLVTVLRYGALPFPLQELTSTSIAAPTLP